MRLFPTLGKQTVNLIDRHGREYPLHMLPAGRLDAFYDIVEEVKSDPAAAVVAAGRRKLRLLIEPYFPEPLRQELLRMDYGDLVNLAGYLFFGDDMAKQSAANAPKPASDDFESSAALVMTVFPGYTLAGLLELPVPVLGRLAVLSRCMLAERAISEHLPAIAAANGSRECFELLKEQLRHTPAEPEHKMDYTPEQLDAAYRRMEMPQRVIKSMRIGDTYDG